MRGYSRCLLRVPKLLFLGWMGCIGSLFGQDSLSRFQQLENLPWETRFFDSGTADWKQQWTLDGTQAKLSHSELGMDFSAGPKRRDDAHHAVLWTKQSFEGSIRIEYTYTKLDDRQEAVTILYVQATGSGEEGYEQDIATWANNRRIPAMHTYFRHMHALHISYAAYRLYKDGKKTPSTEPWYDYIRARRYLPERKQGLAGTDLRPDYFNTGLFETGVPYHITVIKHESDFFFFVQNEEKHLLCHWKLDEIPPITEGRIGLRHMWTRSARYKDFRVSQLSTE